MSQRISYAEKEKSIPQRRSRVSVPNFDNSDLIKKHSLTLIGRTTHPCQRIWSLIPFLSDIWKTSSRAIGADLGKGLFQFQFSNEEDLQLVLANRPYHFAKWMIILQRWEPISTPNFPSQIPFWIRVQGIPVHLCSKETLQTIGSNIGFFEKHEIKEGSARMRVHVDGLEPLITTSTVDFYNGDEATVTLIYEKLERHCSICHRLNHEAHNCSFVKPTKQSTNSHGSQERSPMIQDYQREPPKLPGNRDSNRRDYKDASESIEGKEALSIAASKHGVPSTEVLSDVASYCNERKFASRKVKDACDKLYTWFVLKKKEVFPCEGRVMNLGSRFMTVYISKLGIERRIYYDQTEGLCVDWLEGTSTLIIDKLYSKRGGGRAAYVVSPCDLCVAQCSALSVHDTESSDEVVVPAVFPLSVQVLSTIPVVLHAVGGDDGPLDLGARLYMTSYYR